MNRYPKVSEAKAHARFISKTLKINTCHSQEIVSYIYGCSEWAELKSKQNTFIDANFTVGYYDAFEYLFSKNELAELDTLVSPYNDELRALLNDYGTTDSLVSKIIEKKYSQISGQIIRLIIDSLKEEPVTASNLLENLYFLDDTINNVLYKKANTRIKRFNTHLLPKSFRQEFYAYYEFNNSEVLITCKEWDLNIFRPTTSDNKMTTQFLQSACSRKWFVSYMVGYLKLIAQDFRMAGYNGSFRIHKVQDYCVTDYFHRRTNEYEHSGIGKLFRELLNLGGKFIWEVDSKGNKNNVAIEIPFREHCNQWMIGESSL